MILSKDIFIFASKKELYTSGIMTSVTNKLLKTLFIKSIVLSASTFGGGFVIVSIMRSIYVQKLKLISEEDMMDITAISQSAPGAVAVNASILLGYKTAGFAGAAVCVLGTILPPLIIMSAAAFLYSYIRNNPYAEKIMPGMQAGVAAVILNAVAGMTKNAFKSHRTIYYLLFALIFILIMVFNVKTIYCIIIAAAFGISDSIIQSHIPYAATGKG